MEIDKHQADVERIERFQSLQAGQYWRAMEQIGHEGIDKGEVLLLESIKWADGAAHKIVLRAHPLKYGTSAQYEYPDGKGGTLVRWMHWGQHAFVIADFLEKFEFEPDAEAVRIRELASVQAAVDAKQAEMMDFSSNPETMARVIEDGLRKAVEKERSENGGTNLPALSPEVSRAAANVATGSIGNALMTGMTEQKIEMLKAAAGREHLIATIKSDWIAEHSKAISDTIGKMTPFYHEKAAAALAQTEDVRNYVAKIMSGVATLDLYVGKDVYVETIRTGEPAPKGEPLTFVQSKLCVDEELAVHYDVQEWFDFRNEEKFFDVLRTNDDLVRQIFPTDRCVVAVATTRRNIDYGDGLSNYLINKANKQVFLLVRDGWNIHQVISPVESHLGASKLFPSRGEGDAIFRGVDGSAVKFDDIAFSEKTSKHASAILHYKRFLILCAGLDHRLKLFGDFYDERDAMQFVTLDFQDRYCRFIRDGDSSASLPTTARQPVAEWIAEKNGYLQSGSRLACNWYTLITPDTAPTACNTYERRNYSLQYTPTERVGTAVVYRDGKSLCVDVELSGESRTKFERRTFNAKVNLSAYNPRWGSSEEIPCLVLDKVSPEEVEWYIHNRGSRTDHITYIRLFKVAAKMLKAERAAEADTRSRLKTALIDGRIADQPDCEAIVDTAVAAWRAANRGKPLPTFDGNKAPPQWKNILDQMFAIARGTDGRVEQAEEFVTALGYNPLRLAVTGDGRFVAYAAPTAEERDDRFERHCSVHRIVLDFKKGGVKEKSRRWVRIQRADATENVLKEWDGLTGWFDIDSSFLSLAAKKAALAPLTELRPRIEKFARKLDRAEFEDLFDGWLSARDDMSAAEGRTVTMGLAYPFALMKDKKGSVKVLAVGVEHLHALLSAVAPSAEDKDRVKKAYLGGYGHKAHAVDVFNNSVGVPVQWRVYGFGVTDLKADKAYFDGWKHDYKAMAKMSDVDPLIGATTAKALETARAVHYSSDLAEVGASVIDQFLAIRRPDGYGPYKTEYTRLSKGGEVPPLGRWIDSAHADFEGSIRGELPKELSGYGQAVSTHTLTTKAAVEVHVARVARKEGGRAVHHSAMPDAPQPPEGVDRWFIVKG